MVYLTYEEYKAMGGSLDAVAFSAQEFRARQLIDALTHNRVQGETPARAAVKYATHALIALQMYQMRLGGREVASETNEGVSVSYASTGPNSAYARRVDIVCEYLAVETTSTGVPLLYAGVDA